MNHPLAPLFDQFLKERTYLKNVTDRTLVWYRVAFKNYAAVTSNDAAVLPTKVTLQHFVVSLRERGIKPVTCNTYVGAMNAFCGWLHEEGHARERVKLPKLRVERRLLTLLDDAQMRVLICYKPTTFRQARVHLAVLLILDTGLRISEALHLRAQQADCDNLVLKVFGKGQKERLVPFSPELRKRLYRYQQLRAKKGSEASFCLRGSRARAGRSATARRRSTSYRTSSDSRASDGTSCGTRSRQTTCVTGARSWALDGLGAHADHDNAAIPPPTDGGSEREASMPVDTQPDWVKDWGQQQTAAPYFPQYSGRPRPFESIQHRIRLSRTCPASEFVYFPAPAAPDCNASRN